MFSGNFPVLKNKTQEYFQKYKNIQHPWCAFLHYRSQNARNNISQILLHLGSQRQVFNLVFCFVFYFSQPDVFPYDMEGRRKAEAFFLKLWLILEIHILVLFCRHIPISRQELCGYQSSGNSSRGFPIHLAELIEVSSFRGSLLIFHFPNSGRGSSSPYM